MTNKLVSLASDSSCIFNYQNIDYVTTEWDLLYYFLFVFLLVNFNNKMFF